MNTVASVLKTVAVRIADMLIPPRCHICQELIASNEEIHLCSSCKKNLKKISSPECTICGIPFHDYHGGDHSCGECIAKRPKFDQARSAFEYEGVISELINALKYDQKSIRRRPLALLMVESLGDWIASIKPDFIVPVPLHQARLREREFNQSILIGEIISRKLGIRLKRETLIKNRNTMQQMKLHHDQRLKNLKDAFDVKQSEMVIGKRVLLLDDVMTTGSTFNECAKTLKKAGASAVFAASVARTVKK